jgi:hypothetical protein
MIVARRFNAGFDAEFDKVPKGRLNGPRHFGISLGAQHQIALSVDLAPSAVPSGLVVLLRLNPALKRRAIFK